MYAYIEINIKLYNKSLLKYKRKLHKFYYIIYFEKLCE